MLRSSLDKFVILSHVLAIVGILGYSFYLFSDVIWVSNLALATRGDGPPVLGLMSSFFDDISRNSSWHWFLTDSYRPTQLFGEDAQAISPVTWMWKALWYLGNLVSDALDAMDLISWMLFSATLVVLYVLSWRIFKSKLSAVCAVFLFAQSPISERLYSGHPDLGVLLVPITLVFGLLMIGQRAWTPGLGVILGIILALCFSFSPYYAYFGSWFAFSYLVSYLVLAIIYQRPKRGLVKMSVPFLGSFFLVMCAQFPGIIVNEKLRPLLTSTESVKGMPGNRSHEWHWFEAFSADRQDFLGLLWGRLIDHELFGRQEYFITSRIGTLCMASILVLAGYLYVRNRRKRDEVRTLSLVIIPLTLGSLAASLLALHPKYPVSLVPVTYALAPMFRCADRALVYVQVASLCLLIFLLDRLRREHRSGWAVLAMVLVCGIVGFDMSRKPVAEKFMATEFLPFHDIVGLRSLPVTHVVELPLAQDPSYEQIFHYAIHRKTILNTWAFKHWENGPVDSEKLKSSVLLFPATAQLDSSIKCMDLKVGQNYAFCQPQF